MLKKSFFWTWVLVGLILAFQYNSSPLGLYDDNLEEEKDFNEIISIIEIKKNELSGSSKHLEESVKVLTSNKIKKYDNFNTLELESWNKEIIGDWLEIILDWQITASDLRDLVNVLRESQSKAISIWPQRVIYKTSIIDLKDAILVWNTRMKLPISVKAIWDATRTSIRIIQSSLLASLFEKEENQEVEIEIVEKQLTIPKI